MTDLKYRLLNPTGNITALVESIVPEKDQPYAAEQILQKEITCEQVGFISEGVEGADITLRMAGGEFCGNATMSTAVLYCVNNNIKPYDPKDILVKVVGTEGLINVKVTYSNGKYLGTVRMPKAVKISKELFRFEGCTYEYPVVSFAAISHVICEEKMPIYMAENAIKPWCEKLGTKGMGFMMVSDDKTSIRPLVYVNNPETLYWESSCASGTTAVGAYLSMLEGKDVEYSFKEPGGVLTIKACTNGDLYLSGVVEC